MRMMITEEQKKEEQKVFTAVWEFYKKYYTPDGTSEYWETMVDEMGKIGQNIGRLGQRLLIAIVDEISDRYKARDKK